MSLNSSGISPAETGLLEVNADTPVKHEATGRCQCGCVPNILSMFEMARLRDERRKQKKAQEEQKNTQVT
jgi:hypothetical protein